MLTRSTDAPRHIRGVTRVLLLMGSALVAAPGLAQTPPVAEAAVPETTAIAEDTGVAEIIVTAERRSENLQRVPLSLAVLGEQKLNNLQVQSFSDFAKFLPSVTFQTTGPATNIVYIRGIASGGDGNHSGPLPSVGIYLDEQPITTIGGTLDLHVYDIARIEALSGPQGTLYGASSESGTIKYVSNRPVIGKFSAGYDLEVNAIDGGGWGGVAEAFVNIPLSDRAALRVVGWYDRDGGYIDNIPATRTYSVPGITIDNAAFAKDNYNTLWTAGGRAMLMYELNDDWTIMPAIMGQVQSGKGFFGQDPNLGTRKVAHFAPETFDDSWVQAALTIEGKLSDWDIVYAGTYLDRQVDTQADYSDYSFFYDAFYTSYVDFIKNNAGQFIDPSQRVVSDNHFTKLSQEIRVSSPQDKRFRLLAGAFYQRQTRDIEENYLVQDLATDLSVTGRDNQWWLTKQTRVDTDYAAFGQAAFDIVDTLTLTAGGRVFIYDNSLIGFFGFGAGNPLGPLFNFGEVLCFAPPTTEGAPCTNLGVGSGNNVQPRVASGQGTIGKLNLAWQATPDLLFYGTWSRGYRPGGINRNGNLPNYNADYLMNYEFGWKTSFLDSRLRFNGAIFQQDWSGVQLSFLGQVGLTEIQNAGNARIRGVEFDITAVPVNGLTLSAAGTYINAELTTNYCRIQTSETNADCTTPDGNFIRAPIGQQLPVTPEFKGNIIARYDWTAGQWDAHVQGAVAYTGPRWAALRTDQREIYGRMSGYTLLDLTAGVARGNYTIAVYVNNVLDDLGNISRSSACSPGTCGGITYQFITQPRTFGLKFGQRF